MDSNSFPFPLRSSRLGFHYFPDTLHYRESDLAQWLPELAALGANWLVLQSPADRAIPEHFIRGLIEAGIEPLINFNLPLTQPTPSSDFSLLFKAYSRWGVHGILLFERPNAFQAWTKAAWGRQDLVERFIDRFMPLAGAALEEELVPILPPLEPGGSYWDTSFLHSMLTALVRRNLPGMFDKLVISAYAFNTGHDLNWGSGGQQQWPGARPYYTPPGQQDHLGFHIFDWYREISQTVLNRECPMILFGAGTPANPFAKNPAVYSPEEHRQINLDLVRLADSPPIAVPAESLPALHPLPANVLACNCWLLAADPASAHITQAWYSPTAQYTPTVQAVREWQHRPRASLPGSPNPKTDPHHPIEHYVLLPTFEWGVADWHLEVIRPFVKRYRPTVGFSIDEALLARTVTIIGTHQSFSDEELEKLVLAGCKIRRIVGDGTSIATQLTQRGDL
jgi:hypothetical protein